MNEPLVSILVANHNNAKYIGEALGSIVNQTYSNIEIVVVDDASTDDSVVVIEEFIKAHPDNSICLTSSRSNKLSLGSLGFSVIIVSVSLSKERAIS